MWLPDFLLPETAAGFGPVSKIVGGGVGVLLIGMASLALVQTDGARSSANVTTLAAASSDWQQQVSDQAASLSDACAKAAQLTVPDEVSTDDGVVSASQSLNTVVTNSCAFGTLHQMQQAVYGNDTRAWTQDAVTQLVNQGTTATTNLTDATNALSDSISQAQGASSQAQLATAVAAYQAQVSTVGPMIDTAQSILAGGTPADASTATDLQAEVATCNGAMTADQSSADAVMFATTTLQTCATQLPQLTTALMMSQQAANQTKPTSTPTPSATKTTAQPPATQPPATQPPATQPPATQPPATQPPATAQPTHAPKQNPSIGKATISADSGSSITVQVYVLDPDHVGYTVCFFNSSTAGSKVRNTGTQTVSGTVSVSQGAARNPGAMLC